MKTIRIKRKEWINGSLLLAAGILFGALVFSSSGNQSNTAAQTSHNHNSDTSTEAGQKENTTWTCSMHPQVRQDEPGQCPICGMDLIPAEESEQSQDPAELKMTDEAIKLAEIQTSQVTKSQATKQIHLTGKVQVDERRIYIQPSHIPGRIENLSVQFKGEYVQKGQPIATVYSPDLISAQEELMEAHKTQASNPELLESAREKLRQWKLSEEQIKTIEEQGDIQEHITIRADVGGIVHEQMVREGDYVQKGTRLFHIAQIDQVWVMFDAYQDHMQFVEVGDRIEFTVSSMPGKTFTSRVAFVDPLMNEQSRVAQIRTEASNANGLLKPGMFADGVLHSAQAGNKEELIVPESAVMWTGERSVVFVRQKDQKKPVFRMRQVLLGPSLGDAYIIKEGLKQGEKVVTHGTFAVDAATQLAGKPSMMNQKGASAPPAHDHSGHETTTSTEAPETHNKQDENTSLKWPEPEKENYNRLVDQYLALKDQLVNDQKASEQAENMAETIQSINMDAFSQQAHMKWMELQNKLLEKSKAISQADDVEAQRKHFIALSDAMISTAQAFKAPANKLFVQFCPMADNDQGAFWLSSQEKIRNPYFGDTMLTCGEVREEVEAK